MENCSHTDDFKRINEEIIQLRQCKEELRALSEFKHNSEDKIKDLKDNIDKLFYRIEGQPGIKNDIAEIRNLLTKFEENINELFERFEKIEESLKSTIENVNEMRPMIDKLIEIESDRKKDRKQFRIAFISVMATLIISVITTWMIVSSSKVNTADFKQIITETVKAQKDVISHEPITTTPKTIEK